jgi:non-homologous end joining protein Ku
MVALGRVVFTSRGHVIAQEPRGKGLLGITLRYPYKVRKEDEYFQDIPDEKILKDMLELTSHRRNQIRPTLSLRNLRTNTKVRSRSCWKRSRLVRRSKHLESVRRRKSSI